MLTIRAALSGYGWWGQHLASRLEQHEQFDLVGVFAPELTSETDAGGLRVFPSFEALIEQSGAEAVLLTSPNDQHERQAINAAKAGLHVWCEKPLALNAQSARSMVDALAQANRVLAIGHERRFEPAMQRVADLIKTGDLGTIMHAEAAFSHDKLAGLPKDNWRTQTRLAPAAGMTGMGIHLTDFMIWMFGEVETVQALTTDRTLGWETGDVVTVQLKFRAGMTATLSAILNTPHFIRYQVFGSQQWVEVRNDTHPDTPGGAAHLTVCRTGEKLVVQDYPWTDTVMANLSAFADAIKGKANYPFTADEMIHNIEVLEAIASSADTGETARL